MENHRDPDEMAARIETLEAELANARRTLAEFFEILPVAMMDIELPSLRILYINRLGRIVFGLDPDGPAPELTLLEVVPEDELNRILRITTELQIEGMQPDGTYRRTGRQDIYETLGLRADGKLIPVEFQSMYLLNEQQVPYGSRVMFRDITQRREAEAERERLLEELQEALSSVRTLEGLLPICAWCRKVRDDGGYWSELERYIHDHSDARFSHGICPDCAAQFNPVTADDPAARDQKR